ncbi:probable E3 ubiquitin-protein ligase HERC3, partial [Hemiscyllium ocellatum]|uniref:probable E3 ubiquitin-protein ligase HERC3 n=1 Tax=Hemiscyllium ocellatum TaxID=170820 RepID=UPI002966B2CA
VSFMFRLLKGLSDRKVVQVACGNNHSLALTKDSQIFAWGQNTYGQLGVGMDNVSQHSPQSVISLTGMPVAQITAGGDHSFTLSLSGTVFGWGRNNHGQLGLKDTEGRQKPSHVKLLDCKKVVHIACGEEHTAVLTKDGLVFTFGAGSYGQLGHNSTEDETKPHLVGYLFGKKASQIACGSYHTLVFIPSSGKIYSFGCGEKGQLGNRETKDQLVPLPINIIDLVNKNGNGHTTKSTVRRIFAGGNQSFAACSRAVDLVSSTDQSALNTLRRITTVDKLLERGLNKITRKAIVRAFSSPQALCGSFLNVSKDGHFKTNGVTSGLDLSAIYLSFLNLAKNSLTLQVKTAVQHHLIPSLPRSPTCVETLRVYIIIPELIAVLDKSEDSATLLESLNRSILSLEDSYFKILVFHMEPEMDDAFYLVGILCGLAVSNGFICNVRFPLALYKKLLSVPPTLEDLKELSPTLGTSLQDVLDYEYDDIEEMLCLDFTVNKKTADGKIIQQELIPDGSKIPVQEHNRKQYVDAVVDYKLNTSVKKQFEAFSQGFRSCYSLPIVDTFLPEELRDVIQGSTRYDWELLEQNAKYVEYQNTDRAVRNFWQVFENLPEEKKKRFLAFLSGTDRIPAGGIQNYCIRILKSRTDEPDSSYPRAYTCTMSLELPNYSSIELLREKLLHAIEFSEEFNAQPP